MVNITLRVIFKPDPNNLPWMYRNLGIDFDERILPSIVNEVSASVRPCALNIFPVHAQ